jgi:hypothetical protein
LEHRERKSLLRVRTAELHAKETEQHRSRRSEGSPRAGPIGVTEWI